MKENTLELSFEMYEELKETLIKTLRSELDEARNKRQHSCQNFECPAEIHRL